MIEKEKEVQLKMEDILSKPENIREKIAPGRLDKMVNAARLKQDFIKDTSKTVEELIKEATAEIGEKSLHPLLRQVQLRRGHGEARGGLRRGGRRRWGRRRRRKPRRTQPKHGFNRILRRRIR